MKELEYITDDTQYGIKITDDLIDNIISICDMSNRKETGGILIGYYSSDQKWAHITLATRPTKDSKHSFCTFFRGVWGLMHLLDNEWEKNGCYYIGEWHYHPRALPIPSPKDIKQMMLFSRDLQLKCPEPILLIVGGDSTGWSHSLHLIVQNNVLNMQLK